MSDESDQPQARRFGIGRLFALLPLLFLIALLLFMNQFSPLGAGPAGILLVFALIYGFFLSLIFILIHFGQILLSRFAIIKLRDHVRPKKAYYIATITALAPLFLLGINTIGELRAVDVLLVMLFIGLATFYIVRRIP